MSGKGMPPQSTTFGDCVRNLCTCNCFFVSEFWHVLCIMQAQSAYTSPPARGAAAPPVKLDNQAPPLMGRDSRPAMGLRIVVREYSNRKRIRPDATKIDKQLVGSIRTEQLLTGTYLRNKNPLLQKYSNQKRSGLGDVDTESGWLRTNKITNPLLQRSQD